LFNNWLTDDVYYGYRGYSRKESRKIMARYMAVTVLKQFNI